MHTSTTKRNTKGNKIRSGCVTPAFAGAQKRAKMRRQPCILRGPQRQARGAKSEVATSPVPSRGPKRGQKCMGTYGVGGINFSHTHFDTNPPPLPPSIRSISDISHILSYTLQKQHAASDIRHKTLYTILPWPCHDSFLGPDFVSSANLHVKLCYIGRVPTNWWPSRVLCALWTRRPIVKVAMGCHTEPGAVHLAHVLQRLHFFQFFNFF